MLAGTQPPPPDFRITSLVLSNQDATLIWDTALNNSYRILVTSSRSDPNSWQTFIGPYPWQDPDFLATGTNFMFTTNVIANSTDNPNYNPDLPLFFRIFSQSYNPRPLYPEPTPTGMPASPSTQPAPARPRAIVVYSLD